MRAVAACRNAKGADHGRPAVAHRSRGACRRAGRAFAGDGRLSAAPLTLWTAGHSSLGLGDFVTLLGAQGIGCLVDVRAYPRSRRHPHFSREPLAQALGCAGIRYVWEGRDLGGHREGRGDPRDAGVPSGPMRAYVEYSRGARFATALERIRELAARAPTAVMCAEADPLGCHRRFIADRLVAGGDRVLHIRGGNAVEPHRLHHRARIEGGRIVYDSGAQAALAL